MAQDDPFRVPTIAPTVGAVAAKLARAAYRGAGRAAVWGTVLSSAMAVQTNGINASMSHEPSGAAAHGKSSAHKVLTAQEIPGGEAISQESMNFPIQRLTESHGAKKQQKQHETTQTNGVLGSEHGEGHAPGHGGGGGEHHGPHQEPDHTPGNKEQNPRRNARGRAPMSNHHEDVGHVQEVGTSELWTEYGSASTLVPKGAGKGASEAFASAGPIPEPPAAKLAAPAQEISVRL